MGTTATVVYKRIASLIAEKYEKPYSKTIHWIRCKLSFSLLRSSIMCLRGSRSALHHPANPPDMDLACSEGRVLALQELTCCLLTLTFLFMLFLCCFLSFFEIFPACLYKKNSCYVRYLRAPRVLHFCAGAYELKS